MGFINKIYCHFAKPDSSSFGVNEMRFADESVPQPPQEERSSGSSSENTTEAKYRSENIWEGQI